MGVVCVHTPRWAPLALRLFRRFSPCVCGASACFERPAGARALLGRARRPRGAQAARPARAPRARRGMTEAVWREGLEKFAVARSGAGAGAAPKGKRR